MERRRLFESVPLQPSDPTTQPNPDAELQALFASFGELAQKSLDIAKHCVDVHSRFPALFKAAVAAEVAVLVPPAPVWVEMVPRTPEQLEAAHPPGQGDDGVYHVVTVGREPGIYRPVDSDDQVLNVPNAKRKRKEGRVEALHYYRLKYNASEVQKWAIEADLIAAANARSAATAVTAAGSTPSAVLPAATHGAEGAVVA